MPGYYGQQIQGALPGAPLLRDFTHASKTFLSNGYALTPKLKFLFHVYFDINAEAYPENLSTGNNFGLAVKTIKLPTFNFKTESLNQYNRKRIIQTKIQYSPVNLTFHDDNSNMMNKLWEAYYTYYYSDGAKVGAVFNGARGNPFNATVGGGGSAVGETDAAYNTRNVYNSSITGNANWGYIGEGANRQRVKIPFFKNVTVFGFNQHKFTAYTLINPIITSFGHDTYSYADGGGTMELNMDMDYETVVYNEGAIDGQSPANIVKGFGLDQNYDRTRSPITPPGSNRFVAENGGYIPTSGGYVGPLNKR